MAISVVVGRLDARFPRISPTGSPVKKIRYNANFIIDYISKMMYECASCSTRGVSGDDPDGGAGCGVDRGS
jgi:hypothetical protein